MDGFRSVLVIVGANVDRREVCVRMVVVLTATAVGKDTMTVQVELETCRQKATVV